MADSKVSALAAVTTVGATDDLYVAVSGASKRITGENARYVLNPPYALVQDQKSEGTVGGTFTSGAYRVRDLNTVVEDVDSIVASVASNRITLVAGTYRCRIRCPAYNVSRNRARLYNFTDSAVVLQGSSGQHCSSGSSSDVYIVGKFTIAASKALEIQHRCQTTSTTYGFGVPSGDSWSGDGVEMYTEAEFWKIG